jgi:hypothetical protein
MSKDRNVNRIKLEFLQVWKHLIKIGLSLSPKLIDSEANLGVWVQTAHGDSSEEAISTDLLEN